MNILVGVTMKLASCFSPGQFEEKDELRQDDMKKRMNSSYSSNRPGSIKIVSVANSSNDLCLLFCINPSSIHTRIGVVI